MIISIDKVTKALGVIVCFLMVLSSCKHQDIPVQPVIQDFIKQAFSDRKYKFRMGTDNEPPREFSILYNKPIKDSLTVDNNIYHINPEERKFNPNTTIIISLDSINLTSRVLNIEHIDPNLENKINGVYHFAYKNKVWILTDGGMSISDGHYMLPNFKSAN